MEQWQNNLILIQPDDNYDTVNGTYDALWNLMTKCKTKQCKDLKIQQVLVNSQKASNQPLIEDAVKCNAQSNAQSTNCDYIILENHNFQGSAKIECQGFADWGHCHFGSNNGSTVNLANHNGPVRTKFNNEMSFEVTTAFMEKVFPTTGDIMIPTSAFTYKSAN